MSLVSDQVRRLDAYLDRLPVLSETSSEDGDSQDEGSVNDEAEESSQHDYPRHLYRTFAVAEAYANPRLDKLLRIVRSLSAVTSSNAVLPTSRIRSLLVQSDIPAAVVTADGEVVSTVDARSAYEVEIEWLLVGKATIQVYGVILNRLLDQIIPLSDGIWYWDEVLASYTYSSLYMVQTSPLRFLAWSHDVYAASKARFHSLSLPGSPGELVDTTASTVSERWSRFYNIVRESVRERSISNLQRRVLSPVAYCRSEARRKQAQLRKLREITASGLGILVDEGLQFAPDDDKFDTDDQRDLRGVVERSVALMDMILKEVRVVDVDIHDFEDKVFNGVEEDPDLSVHLEEEAITARPTVLARRLLRIIDQALPEHMGAVGSLAQDNGRPSRLVRYWFPALIGALSSTTVLRLLLRRKADILAWISEFGTTVQDFWFNWVVEPAHKVVRTIRHDATSEIAILSRDSLKADRESLERMVVDFAIDKPHFAGEGPSLTEEQISAIRSKVAEGDVTPVLKAFEKDLRSPIAGAVRGDLVRSLLIQVQKTKVDLEVAMTGIDSLLKSQELVFGFVGLTPGLFVSVAVFRYLKGTVFGRSSQRQRKKAGRAVRIFRNVDRILSEARPTENNVLSYKDHGLLLCELHVLRSLATKLMPREIEREFLEDVDDLANVRGIQVQARALERIRWAYARWLK